MIDCWSITKFNLFANFSPYSRVFLSSTQRNNNKECKFGKATLLVNYTKMFQHNYWNARPRFKNNKL